MPTNIPSTAPRSRRIAKLRPALRQGRHGDRRQRLGHQRRRRRRGADEGERGAEARHDPARAHRVVGACRCRSRRSWAPARSRLRARRSRRPAGRSTTSISSKPTRPSRRRPARSTRTSAGTPARSTSTAAPSRSATRSARPARACWYAALRDAEAQCQEGPRHALHRRRHGHCNVRRAVSDVRTKPFIHVLPAPDSKSGAGTLR